MKIKLELEIGTEGDHCWLCDWNPNSGSWCELFKVKLKRDAIGCPPTRADKCLAAALEIKQ